MVKGYHTKLGEFNIHGIKDYLCHGKLGTEETVPVKHVVNEGKEKFGAYTSKLIAGMQNLHQVLYVFLR